MGGKDSKQLCRRGTIRGSHPTQSNNQVHFGAALSCKGKGKNRRILFIEVRDGGILHGTGIEENDELVSVNERAVDKEDGVDSVLVDIRKTGTIMLEMRREVPKEKKPVYFIVVFNLSCSMDEGEPRIHQYGFFWRTNLSEWRQVAPPVMRDLSRPGFIPTRETIPSRQGSQTEPTQIQRQRFLPRSSPQPLYCIMDCREVVIIYEDSDKGSLQLVADNNSLRLNTVYGPSYSPSAQFTEYAYIANVGPNSGETLVVYVSCQDPSKCIASTPNGGPLCLIRGFSCDSDPDPMALFNQQLTMKGDSYHFSVRGTRCPLVYC